MTEDRETLPPVSEDDRDCDRFVKALNESGEWRARLENLVKEIQE